MKESPLEKYATAVLVVLLCGVFILSVAATYYETFVLKSVETIYPEELDTEETSYDLE